MSSQAGNHDHNLDGKYDKSTRQIGQKMKIEKPQQVGSTLKQQDHNETFIDLKTKQGWQRKYNEPTGYWIGGAIGAKAASEISTVRGENVKSGLDRKGVSVVEKRNGIGARSLGSLQQAAQEMEPGPKLGAPLMGGWTRLGSDVLKQSPPSPQQGEDQKHCSTEKLFVRQQKLPTNTRTKIPPKAKIQSITDNLGTPIKVGWARLGSDVVKQGFQQLQQSEVQDQQQGHANTHSMIPPNDKARCECNQFSGPLTSSDKKNLLTPTKPPVLVTQRAGRQKHLKSIEFNFFDGVQSPHDDTLCGLDCPKVDDEIQFPNLH